MDTRTTPSWRRSPYCDTSTCVETAILDDYVGVRDSKDPDGPVLLFHHSDWNSFVLAAAAGEFSVD